jgi:hypothetical protein
MEVCQDAEREERLGGMPVRMGCREGMSRVMEEQLYDNNDMCNNSQPDIGRSLCKLSQKDFNNTPS